MEEKRALELSNALSLSLKAVINNLVEGSGKS